jgi:hypothetical protein
MPMKYLIKALAELDNEFRGLAKVANSKPQLHRIHKAQKQDMGVSLVDSRD